MAFSADELRVLRRALAEALHPSRAAARRYPPGRGTSRTTCGSPTRVDEAAAEAGRLRAFQLDELTATAGPARDGGRLPGTARRRAGRRLPTGRRRPGGAAPSCARCPAVPPEYRRRTALLRRCENPRRATTYDSRLRGPYDRAAPPARPAGARLAAEPDPAEQKPAPKAPAPQPRPPAGPDGKRPPTPAEIWPPGRRPAPGRKDGKEGDGGEHAPARGRGGGPYRLTTAGPDGGRHERCLRRQVREGGLATLEGMD